MDSWSDASELLLLLFLKAALLKSDYLVQLGWGIFFGGISLSVTIRHGIQMELPDLEAIYLWTAIARETGLYPEGCCLANTVVSFPLEPWFPAFGWDTVPLRVVT